jgi:hypothetical protein
MVLSGGRNRHCETSREWIVLGQRAGIPHHTSSPHSVGQDDDQNEGLSQDRKGSLVLLVGMSPVKSPSFFPGVSRTYCEGDLTSREGLIARQTWKHSFVEERVGVAARPNDSESRPQKEESRAKCSALLPVYNYY